MPQPIHNPKPNKTNMKAKHKHLTTQVKIVVTDDGIAIESPYSHKNNQKFRSRGGHYDRDTGRWIFPNSEATLAMIDEMYGSESELVTACLPVALIDEIGNQWQSGGYVVATRRNSDFPVKMAPGVQVAKGSWEPTGGTEADPKVTGSTDMEIHIVVRKSYAEREGLKILASDEPARNTFEDASIRDLIAELRRRGFNVGNDGHEGLPA